MAIIIQSRQFSSIQAIVMVSGNEDFVTVRKVAEPVDEVKHFSFCACHGEVAGMDNHVSIGQLGKLPMLAVGVGKVEDG